MKGSHQRDEHALSFQTVILAALGRMNCGGGVVARVKTGTQGQGLTLEMLIWTRGGGSGERWEDLE